MTNPLLKAAGITPDTKGHSAERALFDAAWACVERLRRTRQLEGAVRACCRTPPPDEHKKSCPIRAFDKAEKAFLEDV